MERIGGGMYPWRVEGRKQARATSCPHEEATTAMGSRIGGEEALQAKASACSCLGNQKASAVDTELTATAM